MEPVSFSGVSAVERSEELFAPATRRTCAIFQALTHHGQVVELIFHVVPASVHDMVALAHPVQRSRCVLHHRPGDELGGALNAHFGGPGLRDGPPGGRVCFGARPTDAQCFGRYW